MPEWWTYRPEDFLLFSPRVYWRMFELHNATVWPAQILALALGAMILVWIVRPRQWSDRGSDRGSDRLVSIILAAAWAWVAWSFLWDRYATINWAATYVVPAFILQALLLLWIGSLWSRLHFAAERTVRGVVGLALFLYSLVLHPFVATLAGRPFQAAEIFGIAPDPTAIATLGLLSIGAGGATAWLLLAIPLAWCVASWATLHAMGASESWIPLTAAGLAVLSRLWPRTGNGALR